MFERGWEQYVGTGIYAVALALLARELLRHRHDEAAFRSAESWLGDAGSIPADDTRPLARRLRLVESRMARTELLDHLAEASGLDNAEASARFTLTRYILYLLPVIGFIGTVEGISKALVNISKVLPLVKNLDGFLTNLTSVTGALQIAFDSTLLALFLSAWLALVQTVVQRLTERHLNRVDRFVIEEALPRIQSIATEAAPSDFEDRLVATLGRIELALEGLHSQLPRSLGSEVEQLAASVERLVPATGALERSASGLSRVESALQVLPESARKSAATLSRIETLIETADRSDLVEPLRRGVDRVATGVESLAERWSEAMERSNRSTQEQLARTLTGLKDALELLHVSVEQSNALYRSIVKRLVTPVLSERDELAA
jgi:biopolymer transport protein ExbB/TolQ